MQSVSVSVRDELRRVRGENRAEQAVTIAKNASQAGDTGLGMGATREADHPNPPFYPTDRGGRFFPAWVAGFWERTRRSRTLTRLVGLLPRLISHQPLPSSRPSGRG